MPDIMELYTYTNVFGYHHLWVLKENPDFAIMKSESGKGNYFTYYQGDRFPENTKGHDTFRTAHQAVRKSKNLIHLLGE